MKHVFIVNPHAGIKNAYEDTVNALLPYKNDYDVEIFKTNHEKHATELTKEIMKNNPNLPVRFYACGGDGTLNEVVNGAIEFENASVSVYPCGTGNDFVKSVGGEEIYKNLKGLLDAQNSKIDVLRLNTGMYCINVCDFGFDAIVAKRANVLKNKGVKNSYVRGILKGLISGMTNDITVEVDGEIINKDGKILLATIANGAYYGGKFKCAPYYSVDDGKLEFCKIKPVSIFKLLSLLGEYTKGNHLSNPKFKNLTTYKKAEKVKMYSTKDFDVSIDGEIITGKCFEVEILKGALNFGIPKH